MVSVTLNGSGPTVVAPPVGDAGEAVPGVAFVGAGTALGRVAALVDALVAELATLSLAGAKRKALRSLILGLGRVRAGVDAAEARAMVAVDALTDGGVDSLEVLRRSTGCSQRAARRLRWRAAALAQMPRVGAALSVGDISGEHVDALVRASEAISPEAVDGDGELLEQVSACPADLAGRRIQSWIQRRLHPDDAHKRHQRHRKARRLSFGENDDGMPTAYAVFDRVLGAKFRRKIDDIADRLWRNEGGRDNPNSRSIGQRRLDALTIACGLAPPPPAPTSAPPNQKHGQPANRNGAPPASDSRPTPSSNGHRNSTPPASDSRPAPPSNGHRNGARHTTNPDPGRDIRNPGPGRDRGEAASTRGTDNSPNAARAAAGGGRMTSARHQIIVVASSDVISGADPNGRCEVLGAGPIPQSELERLACDAEIFGVVFSGRGDPLWAGRRTRTATEAQRRALMARDGACVLCAADYSQCDAHHIVPWAKPTLGRTDIDNLALLCGTCHRRLHDAKRILIRRPDRAWTTAPDPRRKNRRSRSGIQAKDGADPPGRNTAARRTQHARAGGQHRVE